MAANISLSFSPQPRSSTRTGTSDTPGTGTTKQRPSQPLTHTTPETARKSQVYCDILTLHSPILCCDSGSTHKPAVQLHTPPTFSLEGDHEEHFTSTKHNTLGDSYGENDNTICIKEIKYNQLDTDLTVEQHQLEDTLKRCDFTDFQEDTRKDGNLSPTFITNSYVGNDASGCDIMIKPASRKGDNSVSFITDSYQGAETTSEENGVETKCKIAKVTRGDYSVSLITGSYQGAETTSEENGVETKCKIATVTRGDYSVSFITGSYQGAENTFVEKRCKVANQGVPIATEQQFTTYKSKKKTLKQKVRNITNIIMFGCGPKPHSQRH